jgi:hypothetical protein
MAQRDIANEPTALADAAFAKTVLQGLERSAAPTTGAAPVGRERYVVAGLIGEGGMGRVVEARDLQFSRIVAIKQLRKELAGSSARERFMLEALVTGNLEHSGVPTVHERGELSDGSPFYAMHLVKGQTLGEIVAAAGTLEERLKIVPAIIKVAHTLGYAHERGVVHRDIKPDNVIVGRYGEVVVLDWGIAKVRGVPTSAPSTSDDPLASGSVGLSSRTSHGSVVGTPAYMSPEQASGHVDAVDERTDVFALGALLYHLLAGRAPYGGTSAREVVQRAAKAEFEPLATAAPKAPRGIRAICEKAMSRDPGERHRTAAELAEALETYVAAAVAGNESHAVRWFANAIVAMGMLGVATASLFVWVNVGFKEQGMLAYLTILLSAIGATLSAIEIRTVGRHELSSLSLAFAGATFLLGVTITFYDTWSVMRYLIERLQDPAMYRDVITEGMKESVGAIASAATLAAVQLIFWGIARRTVALSRR